MTGMALEGGGARGAYHVGVARAYLESGFEFDGFVGASIGAVNGAILAQGDFERLYGLWDGISSEQLFDADAERLLRIGEIKLSGDFAANLVQSVERIFKEGGVDTSKMRAILGDAIDEAKLRASGKEFGLVTVSLNERKPYQLYLSDIPEGRLLDYVMASASFPGFQRQVIDENEFLDGGLYNNCPVDMLLQKGYDRIIAVRTLAPGLFRNIPQSDADITVIAPQRSLGHIMSFSSDLSRANMRIGYLDGLKAIRGLKGRNYYVEPAPDTDYAMLLMRLDEQAVLNIGGVLDLPAMPARRMLFEHILPSIGARLKLGKGYDYEDLLIAMLEHIAELRQVDSLDVYSLKDLCALAVENEPIDVSAPPVLFGQAEKYHIAMRILAAQLRETL